MSIKAIDNWSTNGHLIADAAGLGYLYGRVLDCTYGLGTFWTEWRPDPGCLIATDLNPVRSPMGAAVDFTHMPFGPRSFDCVVFDPPYRLCGTPGEPDERYGVDTMRWQDRMALIADGVIECARVLGEGYLLVKVADQVCSGKVRWQTDLVTERLASRGLGKVDRFDFLGGRPQPAGRIQKHARHNASQLLIFKRGW